MRITWSAMRSASCSRGSSTDPIASFGCRSSHWGPGLQSNGRRRVRPKDRDSAQTPTATARRLCVGRAACYGLLFMVAASFSSQPAERTRDSPSAPGRQLAVRTFSCLRVGPGDLRSKHGCVLQPMPKATRVAGMNTGLAVTRNSFRFPSRDRVRRVRYAVRRMAAGQTGNLRHSKVSSKPKTLSPTIVSDRTRKDRP